MRGRRWPVRGLREALCGPVRGRRMPGAGQLAARKRRCRGGGRLRRGCFPLRFGLLGDGWPACRDRQRIEVTAWRAPRCRQAPDRDDVRSRKSCDNSARARGRARSARPRCRTRTARPPKHREHGPAIAAPKPARRQRTERAGPGPTRRGERTLVRGPAGTPPQAQFAGSHPEPARKRCLPWQRDAPRPPPRRQGLCTPVVHPVGATVGSPLQGRPTSTRRVGAEDLVVPCPPAALQVVEPLRAGTYRKECGRQVRSSRTRRQRGRIMGAVGQQDLAGERCPRGVVPLRGHVVDVERRQDPAAHGPVRPCAPRRVADSGGSAEAGPVWGLRRQLSDPEIPTAAV